MSRSDSRANRVAELREVYMSVAENPTTTHRQQQEAAGAKSVLTGSESAAGTASSSGEDETESGNDSTPLLELHYDGLADALGDGSDTEG